MGESRRHHATPRQLTASRARKICLSSSPLYTSLYRSLLMRSRVITRLTTPVERRNYERETTTRKASFHTSAATDYYSRFCSPALLTEEGTPNNPSSFPHQDTLQVLPSPEEKRPKRFKGSSKRSSQSMDDDGAELPLSPRLPHSSKSRLLLE